MQTINAFNELVSSVALAWITYQTGIGPDAGPWYDAASKMADGFAGAAVASAIAVRAGIVKFWAR